MRGLGLRLRTAGIAIPPILAAIYFGPWYLGILLGIAGVLGARELARLWADERGVPPSWPIALAALAGILLQGGLVRIPTIAAIGGITLLGAAVPLLRTRGALRRDLPLTLFGAVYLGFLPAHAIGLYGFGATGKTDPMPVFYALALVWACDTGAFLVGSLLGRHRLWPRVSPKKSWEGAVGGLMACVAIALLLGAWVPGLTLAGRLGGGLIVAFMAQAGDLIESQMKREASIKDSGELLPGHGGALDRIDSLVFSLPALHYWLAWAVRG